MCFNTKYKMTDIDTTANAATAANAANAATASFAAQFKDYMAKMPDTLDSKKEIEAFIKEALKNIKTDDKPKKGRTAYQQFISDNSKLVKEQNPSFDGKKVFSHIATMWNESKNVDKSKKKPVETVETVVKESKEEEEKVEIDDVKEEHVDVKPKAKSDVKSDVKKKK